MTVLNNKKGSALITALVVMVVVMMLCLSLLLISYALLHTVSTESDQQQCKEMARSLSASIQKELVETQFSTPQQMLSSLNAGEHQLWLYLRFNVWNKWNYYNEDNRGHDKNAAFRYFSVKTNGDEAALVQGIDTTLAASLDDITVLIYYEGDEDSGHNGTALYIRVECAKNNQKSAVTTVYQLSAEESGGASAVPGGAEDGTGDTSSYAKISSTLVNDIKTSTQYSMVNPLDNEIFIQNSDGITYSMENWLWTFVERQ